MALRGPSGLMVGLAASLAAPRAPAAPAGGSAALLLVDEVTGPLRQPGQGADSLKVEFTMRKQIWGDHEGNLYYSRSARHMLYRIDATGSPVAVAGNGRPGQWGDGGPASQAGLRYPGPVWGDRSGQVFFVDNSSTCLRRIDAEGIIRTVATFAWPRPSIGSLWGDRSGDIYLTDTRRRQIFRLRAEGDGYTAQAFAGRAPAKKSSTKQARDGGQALDARLAEPNGLWGDDSGSIFVAEMSGNRIRKIDRAGRISTVAGTGRRGYSGDGGLAKSATLNCPCDMWGDGKGSLFVADMGNHRVRKVDSEGNIFTFAGNGSQGYAGDGGDAQNASLSAPKGVWVDRHGAVFISDTVNRRIRRVDQRGLISSFGHLGGTGVNSSLRWSKGLRLGRAPRAGRLISDARGHALLRVAGTSTSRLAAAAASPRASGDLAPADGGALSHPEGLCAAEGGELYVLDSGSSAISVVDAESGRARPLALRGGGGEGAEMRRPVGCSWSGGRLLVTDQGSHRIWGVDVSSGEVRAVAGSGEFGCDGGRLGCPYGVASGEEGSSAAFVTDPCCPDAFVRRLDLQSGAMIVVVGHPGVTSTDRASAIFWGGFLWIPGIDDCGLEVLDCASGRMHQVQLLDRQGRNMPTKCVVDVVGGDERKGQLDLLTFSNTGDIDIVVVRAPKIVITQPASSSTWPSGVASVSWRADEGDLLGMGELSLVDVSGTIRVSLRTLPLVSGVTEVSPSRLPSAVQGDFFIELASVRWPFVQGRAGPFHFGAGGAAPAPASAPPPAHSAAWSWFSGAVTVAAALLAGAALVVALPFAFLRLRVKDYGRMGGAVMFQWRAGFGGPDAADAQQAEEEMDPMSAVPGSPATPVALGRASPTFAHPGRC